MLPERVLSWKINKPCPITGSTALEDVYKNPKSVKDITVADLIVLKYLIPKPRIIVFGTGEFMEDPSEEVLNFLGKEFEGYEILNTYHAMTTFALMNEENREAIAPIMAFKA